MKSPQIFKIIIIALVFALVGYFAAGLFNGNAVHVSLSLFIGALIAPLLSTTSSASETSTELGEVKTLYVGNLPYRANEAAVRHLFSEHGTVHSVRLMKDKHTGKRRGFGFVEMTAADSDKAIDALNDQEFQQRTLKVREAKERPERSDDNQS